MNWQDKLKKLVNENVGSEIFATKQTQQPCVTKNSTNASKTTEPKKKQLIVSYKFLGLGDLKGLFSGKDPDDFSELYRIKDGEGIVRYKSEDVDHITSRDIIKVFDASKHKIGYVKEHLIPIGMPFFEKDVKKCSVYYKDEKIATLKKSICLGELEFEALEGPVDIKNLSSKRFSIYYKGQKIATQNYFPLSFKKGCIDKYVVEFNKEVPNEIEDIALLVSLAIDIISFGEIVS